MHVPTAVRIITLSDVDASLGSAVTMDFSQFEPKQNERYQRFGERQRLREQREIAGLLARFPAVRTLGACRHFLAMSNSHFRRRIGADVLICLAFGGILILILRHAPRPAAFVFASGLALAVATGLWHIASTLIASARRTFLFDEGLLLLQWGKIRICRWTDIARITEVRSTTRIALTSLDKYDFGRTEFKSCSLVLHLRGGHKLDLSLLDRPSLLFAELTPIAERLQIPWSTLDNR